MVCEAVKHNNNAKLFFFFCLACAISIAFIQAGAAFQTEQILAPEEADPEKIAAEAEHRAKPKYRSFGVYQVQRGGTACTGLQVVMVFPPRSCASLTISILI